MASFSVRRKTPPLRLTSRVSAVCLNVAPPLETHDASTGMHRVTRSLWRRPSEMVVIAYFTKFLNFRLARKSCGNRPVKRVLSFQLITHAGHWGGFAGRGGIAFFACLTFRKHPDTAHLGQNCLCRECPPAIIQRD